MPVLPHFGIAIVGQLGASGGGIGSLLLWTGVLMVVVVASAIALARIRRRLVKAAGDDTGEGWTLHSLRELHQRGQITDEELERAKAVLLGGLQNSSDEAPERPLGVDLTGDPLPRRADGVSGSSVPGDGPQVP